MKKAVYLAGLASGFVLAQNWRSLAKQGVKAGMRVRQQIREFSQQVKEEIGDVGAEAMDEFHREDRAGR